MVTVNREGQVTAEVGEVDVHIGHVTKVEEGDWEGDCALCEDGRYLNRTKSGVVDLLEEHFIQTHTTQA